MTYDKYMKHVAEGLISENQKAKMLHAIGWNERSERIYTRGGTRYFKPYRNYYDAGEVDSPAWKDLVLKKFARQYDSGCYTVTNKGLDILSCIMQTYIYCNNSDCIGDAKLAVMDVLIADACYCGYGCWIPNGAKSIAKRARLPLALTRDTLRYLEGEGLVARSHYGEIDDEGYPHCWHGWVMTAKGKERYKERYERAWKAECEYLDKSIRSEA